MAYLRILGAVGAAVVIVGVTGTLVGWRLHKTVEKALDEVFHDISF